MEIKPEIVITQALVKENVTEQVIAGLKGYMGLKITDIYDKKAIAEVKRKRIECRDLRLLAVKICKAGREESKAVTNAWITEEKRVVAEISQVEDYLTEQEDFATREVERIDFENQQKAKLPERVAKLATIGIKLSDESILAMDDMGFHSYFNDKHSEMLEEKGRKQREEDERIEQEKKDLAKKKIESRMKELHSLELKFNGSMFIVLDLTVTTSDIEKMTDDEFAGLILKLTPMIAQHKELEKKKHDEEIEAAKEQARIDEVKRLEQEGIKKENDARIQREKDEKAAALKPDKEKLKAFADQIAALPRIAGALTTKEAKETLAKVENLLNEAMLLLQK